MTNNIITRPLTAAAFALTLQGASAFIAVPTATFEDIALDSTGYWNGSDGSGGFTTNGAFFNNSHNATYGNWSGFAVSNHTDTTTAGWTNQYSAYTGSGAGGSANYAVAYYSTWEATPTISFSSVTDLAGFSAQVTNTTYTALAMLNGDSFGNDPFGGPSGDEQDWFLLTITGYTGGVAGNSIDFYLADYRFSDNSLDYIVDEWSTIDLSSIGSADSLQFTLSSSDVGTYGINTPTYFALDNITVPEPSALLCSLAGLGLLARRRR
ncbi:MAG: DUF4465 domain-containing protein [Verrucomicrobiales bacterium]|nr:DUF4465 domain-containing protein [Verrucomicrobiota bacterium JB025]